MARRDHQRDRTTLYHLPSADNCYDVYLRRKESLRVLDIASAISSCYKSVRTIHQITESKVQLVFTDRNEANHIVQNRTFTARYQVYIPANLAEIAGVIDDPDNHNTSEALVRYGMGHFHNCSRDPVPVLDCCEIANRERDVQARATLLKVTFAGTVLPDFLELDHARVPIRAYFQKLEWCKKCEKFEKVSGRMVSSSPPSDVELTTTRTPRQIARRKSSFSMNPPFNLEQIVGAICDGLRLDKNWKVLLVTLLKRLWNNLMRNTPLLGLIAAV